MDFVTDLPECNGYNALFTVVDRLTKYCKIIPCTLGGGELDAPQVAYLFWKHVVSVFGVPCEVLHDHDPRFTSEFWRELWKILGTKTVYTSSYHP